MSEKYPVIDPNDLVGGDEDKEVIYEQISQTLKSYSGFCIHEYKNTYETKIEIDKTLDEITHIFLIYFPEKIENKLNLKQKLIDLLIETFNSKLPSEIKSKKNHKVYWNHFLNFVNKKLYEIKILIPTALIIFFNF